MHKLERYLKTNGITKTRFAAQVGIHISYITHLVKGRKVPSLATAVKIQELTNGAVPVETWLDRNV